MIETIDLIKTFPHLKRPVLNKINLQIQNGEFVSLVGRSGSGKSTLLYLMSTLDLPNSGKVLYDKVSVNDIPKNKINELRNKEIGFVFQFHYLIPELTALENVLLPTRKSNEWQERTQKAMELLKEMGIEDKASRLPTELSGGEQQRVAIARALIMEPTYVFADEPTGNLDSINGMAIINLFKRINLEKGTTIIYVTHDKDFAAEAKRQITLVDGVLS